MLKHNEQKKKKDQQPAQPSIHTPTNKEIWYSVEFELPYKVNEKELDTLFDIMAHYYNDGIMVTKGDHIIKLSYPLKDNIGFIHIFTKFLPPKELLEKP